MLLPLMSFTDQGVCVLPQVPVLSDRGGLMAKYGKKAQDTVESAMRRRKRGTLKSGSGRKVTSRKQAIAIGLSEAREKGAKVPRKRAGGSRKRAGGAKKKAAKKR